MKVIKNEPNLVRDESSGVVLNTNMADYNLILQKRKHREELNDLKSEIDELKALVKALAK
jgi:hypothetical protein